MLWLLSALLLVAQASAHSRWVCPRPRNPGVGLKAYPCGDSDHSQEPLTIAPGPFTVVWEEAVYHRAAPARIALSLDGTDAGFEQCVLLDHIPHNEGGRPVMGLSSTYVRSRLTINIPDVACERCTLQLTSAMSDSVHGVKDHCAMDSPERNASIPPCSIYHSCATVRITGSAPRNSTACPATQPADWPFGSLPPGVYGNAADTARWSGDGLLLDAPAAYRVQTGACAVRTMPLWLARLLGRIH